MWQWCGEGARHSSYLVCVLCVQDIALCESQLMNPSNSDSEEWRVMLERRVQDYKPMIQTTNYCIECDNAVKAELKEKGIGEFPGCQ